MPLVWAGLWRRPVRTILTASSIVIAFVLLGLLQGDSQLVYSLSITPALAIGVVLLACALGLAGGLLPAIRAARANIADALHEN